MRYFLFLAITLQGICALQCKAQSIIWASSVNYDNEISNKDGYNARKASGPPDVENYGKYAKNAAALNKGKTSSLWLDFATPIETKQILILQSNGGGLVLKVELVDALSGTTQAVYENPVVSIKANYQLLRIVLPDNSLKAKQLKIKFSTSQENQQIDAVGIANNEEEYTIQGILTTCAKSPVQFNNTNNDDQLNTTVFHFNPANVNVLGIKKSIDKIGESLKEGESGNLGNSINTLYDELAPLVSPDEQILYFVREGSPENTLKVGNAQDIWCSIYDKETKMWSDAKHLEIPFNKARVNIVVGMTPDGNTCMISGVYHNGTYDNLKSGFSMCHRKLNGWTEPEQVIMKGYDEMNKGVYISSYLANDSKTILLSFSEEKGSDISDVYVSFLTDKGFWSKPLNLGNSLNTDRDESTPFLAADGVTLYFSSNREGGLGKNDIYKSTRLDSTWKKWSTPVNLGPTINTNGWDAYYSIAASGNYAYMVSNKNSLGLEDIVRLKLKEEIKPNPVVLINGKVFNSKTKQPIDANISYQLLPEGTEVGIARSNPENGEYKIVLPYGKKYAFNAAAPGYMAISDNLDLSENAEYKELVRDLFLVPIEVGEIVRLNNIFFDLAKSTLKIESYPELERLLMYLKDNPGLQIEIGGHTDNIGNEADNLQLSDERANSVKNYILSKGIAENRIKSKGYGETRFIAANETEPDRRLNRRVEFLILQK